jgi:ABC-type phosphate/phosphonate transport system permease subunit
MTKNVGPEDRVVRVVVGIALAVLVYLRVLGDIASIIAGILALYLIVTGLLGRCLFYRVADIDTSIQEQPYSTTDDRAGF